MATNWTDLTLFTGAEALSGLPRLFDGLDTTLEADYNFQVDVKRDFERMIKSKWIGVGKLTSSTTDDFDIEKINNGSTLNDSAILYNNLLVAREYMTDLDDPNDKYGSYYASNKKWIDEQIAQDFNLLQFDDPEGVNQLTPKFTRLSR